MMTKILQDKEEHWEPSPGETLLGTGAEFEGTLRVKGDVRIEGKFKGTVHVDGNLYVGKQGEVNAEVYAKNAVISGYVKGNLYIQEKVEFMSGARFEGEVECKGLVVHDGVIFDGNCRMSKRKGKPSKENPVLPIDKEAPTPSQKP